VTGITFGTTLPYSITGSGKDNGDPIFPHLLEFRRQQDHGSPVIQNQIEDSIVFHTPVQALRLGPAAKKGLPERRFRIRLDENAFLETGILQKHENSAIGKMDVVQ